MGLNFFNNLKENLERDNQASNLSGGITEFIGELTEALKLGEQRNNTDIVAQIAENNKLSLASENGIITTRNQVLAEYAGSTKEAGNFYFILNKVKGEDKYRVWKFQEGKRTQTEMHGSELPNNAGVNSVIRMHQEKLVVDTTGTEIVMKEIQKRADKIINEQNEKIEEYKKEGHIYLVTEDINGRIFLWDSTEKPKNEIEDVYFPEELKNVAREGNTFIYHNGTFEHVTAS